MADTAPYPIRNYAVNVVGITYRQNFEAATSWLPVTGAFVRRLTLTALGSNQISQAEIEYYAGSVRPPGEERPAIYPPLGIPGRYVKLLVTTNQLNTPGVPGDGYEQFEWVGIVTQDRRENQANGTTTDQVLVAVGIEWLLTRSQLTNSWIEDPLLSSFEIGEAITFNRFDSLQSQNEIVTGNRSMFKESTLPGESYIFAYERGTFKGYWDADTNTPTLSSGSGVNGEWYYVIKAGSTNLNGITDWKKGQKVYRDSGVWKQTQDLWRGNDIVEYLFRFYVEKDQGSLSPEWGFENTNLLEFVTPVIRANMRTPFDIIKEIANPRRGLTWSMRYEPPDVTYTNGRFVVAFHSYSDQDVDLPGSSGVFPQNNNQQTVENNWQAGSFTSQQIDYEPVYNQVIVRGARYASVANFSIADSSIKEGWRPIDVTNYDEAGINETNYANLQLSEKERAGDTARSTRYPFVYSRFWVPADWDGTVADGENGSLTQGPIFEDGLILIPIYAPRMRFQSWIPLRENVDYSSPDQPVDETEGNAQLPSFQRPFAVFKIPPKGTIQESPRWIRSDEVSAASPNERMDFSFSAPVLPLDTLPGLQFQVSPPHLMAGFDFQPATHPSSTDFKGKVDYRDMIIVAMLEATQHVERRYPPSPTGTIAGVEMVFYIDLSKQCRLDRVVEHTVVDVKNNELVRADKSWFLRDDTHIMEDVARMAWLWYGRARQRMEFNWQHVHNALPVGTLVSSVQGLIEPAWQPNTSYSTGDKVSHPRLSDGVSYNWSSIATRTSSAVWDSAEEAFWNQLDPTSTSINALVTSVRYDFLEYQTIINTDFSSPEFSNFLP